MRPVSTTSPKVNFVYFFIFFQNMVVSIAAWKNTYTWFSQQDLPLYSSHMDANDNFGMLNCIATVARSNQIHVFLSCRRITRIIGTIYHKYSNLLSPTRGITRIFAIFEPFPTYTISFLVETRRTNRIFGIGHQPYSIFSNNTEYTSQLQASTQPTMLRMVLDHNPSAFLTV